MKLLPESECAKIHRQIQALDNYETRRRLLIEERNHKAASFDAKLSRAGKGYIGHRGNQMRHATSIPPEVYFHCLQKYGEEEVNSIAFIKNYQKRFPEHRVTKI